MSKTSRDMTEMEPQEFREMVRRGEWTTETIDVCKGHVYANLVILPKEYAFDFLLFCLRNPRPCPVIEVTEPGSPTPVSLAPHADLRTDVPRYRVFANGKIIDEPFKIQKYWRDDLVSFLLGCAGGFHWALKGANVHYRRLGAYTTNIPCIPAGRFHGHMVVSCRFFETARDAVRAVQISSRHPLMHGAPVHIGDPKAIGIEDLYKFDEMGSGGKKGIERQKPEEVALYWGCGITPQAVAMEAKVPFMITHYPAHMFIGDTLSEELAIL